MVYFWSARIWLSLDLVWESTKPKGPCQRPKPQVGFHNFWGNFRIPYSQSSVQGIQVQTLAVWRWRSQETKKHIWKSFQQTSSSVFVANSSFGRCFFGKQKSKTYVDPKFRTKIFGKLHKMDLVKKWRFGLFNHRGPVPRKNPTLNPRKKSQVPSTATGDWSCQSRAQLLLEPPKSYQVMSSSHVGCFQWINGGEKPTKHQICKDLELTTFGPPKKKRQKNPTIMGKFRKITSDNLTPSFDSCQYVVSGNVLQFCFLKFILDLHKICPMCFPSLTSLRHFLLKKIGHVSRSPQLNFNS